MYPCWTVAIDEPTDTSIVFSDYGFGPTFPWGVVPTSDNWFGMDGGWFETLEEAFRDLFMVFLKNKVLSE